MFRLERSDITGADHPEPSHSPSHQTGRSEYVDRAGKIGSKRNTGRGGRRPRPYYDASGAKMAGSGHQFGEIARVKAVFRVFVNILHRRFKSLERIATAFDMRIVRGKQEQLRPRLLDHPSHRLGREG